MISYEEIKLENSFRIIAVPSKHIHLMYFALFLPGSRYETKNTSGLGHLLEHLLVRNWQKNSSETFGRLSARVSKEFTYYKLTTLPEHSEKALFLLADILRKPTFNRSDIKKEKQIIYEERLAYEGENGQNTNFYELTLSLLWPDTELALDILGDPGKLSRFNKKGLSSYWDKFYRSNNMLLCVVGDFPKNDYLVLIKNLFGKWKKGEEPKLKKIKREQTKPGFYFVKQPGSQVECRLAFPSLSFRNTDYEAVNVLSALIDIKLKKEISDQKGLVYEIDSFLAAFSDVGFLAIDFSVSKDNLSETIKEITFQLNKDIGEPQLRQAKMVAKRELIGALDCPNELINLFGLDKFLACFEPLEERLKRIDKLTINEAQKLARKIFIPQKLNLITIGPYKEKRKDIKNIASW